MPDLAATGSTPALVEALAAAVRAVGGQPRPGQEQMARAVADVMDGGRHAIVQAGTGTGKSLAYLVPAILHAAGEASGPVVVATATLALQRQLVERDLPRICEALATVVGRPVSFAVLKGRNNYVCLNKLNGVVPEDDEESVLFATPRSALATQAQAVRSWAEETRTGDRDEFPGEIDPRVWRGFSVGRRECVGESRCPFGEECFTARRREQAMVADIVVTNHAMLAIDAIEGIPVLPEHDVVIVDEGHELADRITAAVAGELAAGTVERAAGRCRRLVSAEVVARLADAADELATALAEVSGDGNGPMRITDLAPMLRQALELVRDSCHAALTELAADKSAEPEAVAARQQARAALDEAHDVAGSILGFGPSDVVWLEPGPARSAGTVRIAPLSVSGLVRTAVFERARVVVTSATLTVGGQFDATLRAFGLGPDDATTIDVGSPFDYARQGILYVARHVPAPGRDGVAMEALDELAELIEAAGGRTLALFSSWRGVERAEEYLRVRLADRYPLLVQRRGDAVGALVHRFAAEPASVLLGTVSLWQGVDVPGEACICVAIDRIPFPRPDDPLVAARSAAVDEAGGSGFRAIAVPRAGLLLAQGAGRLIRGVDDRGVVAVLDSRLATAGYARTLRDSMPPLWYTTDRQTVVGALSRLRDGFTDPG